MEPEITRGRWFPGGAFEAVFPCLQHSHGGGAGGRRPVLFQPHSCLPAGEMPLPLLLPAQAGESLHPGFPPSLAQTPQPRPFPYSQPASPTLPFSPRSPSHSCDVSANDVSPFSLCPAIPSEWAIPRAGLKPPLLTWEPLKGTLYMSNRPNSNRAACE